MESERIKIIMFGLAGVQSDCGFYGFDLYIVLAKTEIVDASTIFMI